MSFLQRLGTYFLWLLGVLAMAGAFWAAAYGLSRGNR